MEFSRYNTKPCRDCKTVTSKLLSKGMSREEHYFPNIGRVRVPVWFDESGAKFFGSYTGLEVPTVKCRQCARTGLYARPVNGKFRADKKCDGRCTSARGHNCECACGGKNHGADHAG